MVDYSGPNVAKPLHVGHLRSTVIGDSLVRVLRFLGYTVIGDNHLGDWGTQFGILIYGYKHYRDEAAYQADPVRELARLYVHVRALAKVEGDEDEGVGPIMEACRQETAKLHAGDAENVALWQQFMPACLDMLKPIYAQLGVKIDHALGESFYHNRLPAVVDSLRNAELAKESNGAIVVPNAKGIVPTAEQMQSEEPPALIRKRDGAFTYTTTDLATIQYRVETWKPHVMLYVVDARQALHFKTLFANAKRWGEQYEAVEFHHVSFGSILGLDRKPLRTRDGGTVELESLLNDAVALAGQKYQESCERRRSMGHTVPELSAEEMANIAKVVGIGAVKYADLSGHRVNDYIFDADKMLATEGNTATYMQYAYARCRAILRKANLELPDFDPSKLIEHATERALALQLLRYELVLDEVAAKFEPHHICSYLWDLCKAFNNFYESCKVIDPANEPYVTANRLVFVKLTGEMIRHALDLLGISVVEQM